MNAKEKLNTYRKECERHILAIHGIDMSKNAIDEDRLEHGMLQGEAPIDVAIAFDPNNCLDQEP